MSSSIVWSFLAKVSSAEDEKALEAFNLAPSEMELFLAALNALPSESIKIPNLNKIAAKLKIIPHIQTLKKKRLVERGENRGDWNITSEALKKMKTFLKMEDAAPSEETPNEDNTKYDISGMTISQIRERLAQIAANMQELKEEETAIKSQLKKQLSVLQ